MDWRQVWYNEVRILYGKVKEMYIWYIQDVADTIKKNRDRMLVSIHLGNGLVVISTRKGYRYEVNEQDYAAHYSALAAIWRVYSTVLKNELPRSRAARYHRLNTHPRPYRATPFSHAKEGFYTEKDCHARHSLSWGTRGNRRVSSGQGER